jgi:hypothetical protein
MLIVELQSTKVRTCGTTMLCDDTGTWLENMQHSTSSVGRLLEVPTPPTKLSYTIFSTVSSKTKSDTVHFSQIKGQFVLRYRFWAKHTYDVKRWCFCGPLALRTRYVIHFLDDVPRNYCMTKNYSNSKYVLYR